MTELTPERIAQLREILAKATPGEWYVPSHNESAVYGGETLVAITYPCGNGEGGTEVGGCTEESNANARQIVAAVNTLPAALDEIERLSAERDSLIDQVRAMSGVSATLSRVTAERDEAVRLLKPFADFAGKADQFVEGTARFGGSPVMPVKDFRLSHFKNARAFIASMEGRK